MQGRQLSVLLLIIVLLLSCLPAAAREPPLTAVATSAAPLWPGTTVHTLQVNGVERAYRLHLPPAARRSGPLPLVLNFHGLGSSAARQETISGFSPLADRHGFAVVYPQALPNQRGHPHWNTRRSEDQQADLDFVRSLLAELQLRYPIDRQRIYATGLSNGGGMANLLAGEMADSFAAVATVAGAYYDFADYRPARPIPILAFHGSADRIVPYAGRGQLPAIRRWAAFWAQHNHCGPVPATMQQQGAIRVERWSGAAEVILYTLEGHGHAWPGMTRPGAIAAGPVDASARIWAFFARHRLP